MTMTTVPFRFDALQHQYVDLATGEVLPSATQMLKATGYVGDWYYTEESRIRGTAVHALTAEYDLGALDPAKCISQYRGYLLAYAAAKTILAGQGLEILAVEEPMIHPTYRYGVRPDRIVRLSGRRGVLELKSGEPEKHHAIQTALQAMADSVECGIPAEGLGRWCLYLKKDGRFKLIEHPNGRDYGDARRVIAACCR